MFDFNSAEPAKRRKSPSTHGMESEGATVNSWTNWTVVSGTLVNSVTFESSFSGDEDLRSTAKRTPLILNPTSLDPTTDPCEITINFLQKHELRQIYVKSSARVYEIYRQSNHQSEREYVWTVRCSAAAAARDEDEDEVLSRPSNDNHMSKSEANRIVGEDEWVKVKSPDSKQEYYEATAEITDVEPCLLVTLRFLSLQSTGCVFVDEVYVFADPIDSSTESENPVGKDSSSVMGMLLPSLFLMAKTKNSTGMESNRTFETEASCSSKFLGDGITITEKIESRAQGVNMASTEFHSPRKILSRESEADIECTTNDRIERSLEKLCSRIGRIEDMFVRLEQSLVKPMNSIEARLGRVEQQLEELTNKQDKTSEPKPYSTFQAPYFSSVLSEIFSVLPDSSSFSRSESDYLRPCSVEFESNAKSGPASGGYDVVNTTTVLLPSLVMTAPEFSCCDNDDDANDDEEDYQTEDENPVAEGAVEDQPKRALTIDDALSAALAGLMIEVGNHTPALSIKAPEFSNDDGDEAESHRKDSPTESENGSLSKASNNPSLNGDEDEPSGMPMDKSEDTENNEPDAEANDNVIAYVCDEELKVGSENETRNTLLREILESSFSATLPVVDFELPVLDVEFLSRDSSGRGFSLETLLSDLPECEWRGEASRATEVSSSGNVDSELISVEDDGGEPVKMCVDFDYDYCGLQVQQPLSSSREEDEPSLPLASHETFPTTLI